MGTDSKNSKRTPVTGLPPPIWQGRGLNRTGPEKQSHEWRSGELVLLRTFRVEAAKPEKLLAWLDGAAAIRAELPTDALTLTNELGRKV